jgi:hypothetical protein
MNGLKLAQLLGQRCIFYAQVAELNRVLHLATASAVQLRGPCRPGRPLISTCCKMPGWSLVVVV